MRTGLLPDRTGTTIVIALCIPLLMSCKEEQARGPAEPVERPARIMTVNAEIESFVRTFPGRVKSSNQAQLSFEVPGRLIKLPVREGQQVKKGDLIGQLDPRDYELGVRENEVKVKEWAVELDRATYLLSKGHIAQSAFDEKKAKYDLAVVGLDTARQDLDYTTLRAPFDGRIAQNPVKNFENVIKGQTIVWFEAFDKVEVEVDVPETVLASTRRRDLVSLTAVFETLPGREFDMSFKEVSTRPDESTQTYRVVLEMPMPSDANILPGMTATVEAVSISREQESDEGEVFHIPLSAVASDPEGLFFAWKVAEDGSVSKTEVEVASIDGDLLTVIGGLADGDRIVTAGVNFLTEGMKVRPLEDG